MEKKEFIRCMTGVKSKKLLIKAYDDGRIESSHPEHVLCIYPSRHAKILNINIDAHE